MKIVISEQQLKVILEDLVNEQNFDQDFVDSILDKINKYGISSLTNKEKKYLEKISSETGDNYVSPEDDEDEEEFDDESDLPDEFRSDYEFDRTKVQNIEDAAEELAILLDRFNLVKMKDMHVVNSNLIDIYSLHEEGLDFEGSHITAYIKKSPSGNLLVTIVNADLDDYLYEEAANYIDNAWPKKIPNMKLKIAN